MSCEASQNLLSWTLVGYGRFNSCESPKPHSDRISAGGPLVWAERIEMVLDLSSTLCWWSKSNNQPESCGGPTGKMGWAAVNSPHRSGFVNPAVISWETSESSWVCLKIVYPIYPMVLLIIIPFLNGYFIGNINPTFSGPNPCAVNLSCVCRNPFRGQTIPAGAVATPTTLLHIQRAPVTRTRDGSQLCIDGH